MVYTADQLWCSLGLRWLCFCQKYHRNRRTRRGRGCSPSDVKNFMTSASCSKILN